MTARWCALTLALAAWAAHMCVLHVGAAPAPPAPPAPPATNGTGVYCQACQAVVALGVSWAETNATQAELLALVAKACAVLGAQRELCESIATYYDGELEGGLAEVNWRTSICGSVGLCSFPCCLSEAQPEQVHLALAGQADELVVGWTTLRNTSSIVRVGLQSEQYDFGTFAGYTATYTAGGWLGTLHFATLFGLAPRTRYFYIVGDGTNWSDEFFFTSAPALDDAAGLAVLVVGDVGVEHSEETMLAMQAEVSSGLYDFVLHNGDIGYMNGMPTLMDEFMRRMQPVAAFVPYMVSPGNHDAAHGFVAYLMRFVMPFASSNASSSLYWSLDYRHLHLLVFATDEPPGDDNTLFAPGTVQFAWMQADLQRYSTVRRPSLLAAGLTPVLWTAGHRPLYCSTARDDDIDCELKAPAFRAWIEPLWIAYSVDVAIQSHEHAYERTWPVAHEIPEADYLAPNATVYFVQGAGGNIECLDASFHPVPWAAATNGTVYGYSRMFVSGPWVRPLTMFWQFVDAATGAVVDEVEIVQKVPQ